MQNFYDYKRYAILYVDDEEKSLISFARAFGDQFRILTASNARDGLRLLEEHKDDLGLLISDQRMPGEKGVQLLEKARQFRPRILRILATAYSDLEAAIGAVNSGAIYKYVSKPWEAPDLDVTIRRALEFFIVQRERDHLLREKLAVLHNMMITDRVVSLGLLAAGLGHHIRNSLVAVRTFLDLAPAKLQEEIVDVEELRNPNFWNDFYTHVQAQLKRITDMLSELGLATQGTRQASQNPVQWKHMISGAIDQVKTETEKKKIMIRNEVPESLPALNVDEEKIQRLFELLLRDEILSLPEGGVISVSGAVQDREGFSELVITVQDNGDGLPQEAMRSIFDPFFIRHDNPQEFGINLMACFFIVYHHGGRIEVKSDPNSGTSFFLSFPIQPALTTPIQDERDFLKQVLNNETLWEKLLSSN